MIGVIATSLQPDQILFWLQENRLWAGILLGQVTSTEVPCCIPLSFWEFGNVMFPLWFAFLVGSFVFLDMDGSFHFLFLVFLLFLDALVFIWFAGFHQLAVLSLLARFGSRSHWTLGTWGKYGAWWWQSTLMQNGSLAGSWFHHPPEWPSTSTYWHYPPFIERTHTMTSFIFVDRFCCFFHTKIGKIMEKMCSSSGNSINFPNFFENLHQMDRKNPLNPRS